MSKFNVGDTATILDDADVIEAALGEVGTITEIRCPECVDPVYYVTVKYVKFPVQCWDDEIELIEAVAS